MSTSNNITDPAAGRADIGTAMAKTPRDPRRRAPTHPGAVVAGALDELGVSVRNAAIAMGVTGQALGNVIKGASVVSPEMALRLGVYFGNGPELWLNMQRDFDLWHAERAMAAELKKIKPAPKAA